MEDNTLFQLLLGQQSTVSDISMNELAAPQAVAHLSLAMR